MTKGQGRTSSLILVLLPLVLLTGWEVAGRSNGQVAFFFSYPSAILLDLMAGLLTPDGLWLDALYTLVPAILGLVLGALVGGMVGFAIVASPAVARQLRAIVAALGAFPVFAIAPMTLVWFGLGLEPKVFLAFLSCVFLFLQAAYNGGMSVPDQLVRHVRVHGFTPFQEFTKVRLPFAMEWLTSSFKTGANLALLGVFIGEFIASEHGLARVMLDAGSLYDVKRVLAAALCFTALALVLMAVADFVYARRRGLLRWLSVSRRVRPR